MTTPEEYWYRAEALVKLAAAAPQLYARETLLGRAAEFRQMAAIHENSPTAHTIMHTSLTRKGASQVVPVQLDQIEGIEEHAAAMPRSSHATA
jgi:hypothetical protein